MLNDRGAGVALHCRPEPIALMIFGRLHTRFFLTFVTSAAALAATLAANATPTAVGLWRFDEGSGTNAADSSGLGNNGTLQSDNGVLPTWAPSMTGFGSALLFTNDGVSHSYVDVPGSATLQIGQTPSEPWSITAWAYEAGNGAGDYIATYGRILVIDDGDALQTESGASGDDEFYTWSRENLQWQLGWGSFAQVTPLLGQWEHWAVTYDGTNLTVYLDGGAAPGGMAMQAVNAAIAYAGYQGAIHIGSELAQDPSRNWCGLLDDVAVFAGVLTQDDITNHVMKGDFSPFTGGPAHVLYPIQSQTITPGGSATFVATAAGAQPVQYQWYRNSEPLANQTNSMLTVLNAQAKDGGHYTVSVSNTLGGEISAPAELLVINPGSKLLGLWRFDEGSGTNIFDASGYGNDGVLRGENGVTPLWAAGQSGFGTALFFTNDGADHAYVDIPGSQSLMIGQTATNPWSITAWAYESSAGTGDFYATYGRILVIDDGTALQLESAASGDDEFYVWARANDAWQIGWGFEPSVTPLLDQWEHWAVTYDGTNLTLYLNGGAGPKGGMAVTPVTAPVSYPGYMGAVRIGSEAGQPANRNWNGLLDDVAIFNVALTQSQVQTAMTGNFNPFLSTRPTLSIQLSGTNAVVSWPSGESYLQLQVSTNLADWRNAGITPATNSGAVLVTTPLAPAHQFFRLVSP